MIGDFYYCAATFLTKFIDKLYLPIVAFREVDCASSDPFDQYFVDTFRSTMTQFPSYEDLCGSQRDCHTSFHFPFSSHDTKGIMRSSALFSKRTACFVSLLWRDGLAFSNHVSTTTSKSCRLSFSTIRLVSNGHATFSMRRTHGVTHAPKCTPTASLYMANWWQSFFGGGSYNLSIDYDSLPFPAPELATCAKNGQVPLYSLSQSHLELATFAGGCFWGLELAFQRVIGVEYTVVGYTQGRETCPNYEQVGAGNTGHTEAVCVYFDPTILSYKELVEVFLKRIDPTTVNGQGRDFGKQYRTGIYYHSESQKTLAHQALGKVQSKYSKPIATECRTAMPFWPAEAYHQQYLEKGGRFGAPQSAEKNCLEEIRCYG